MGCWGTGVFDDDLALDIKDLYSELILKGYDDRQVFSRVIDIFKEMIVDEDKSIIIYSAIASIQLSRSSLLDDIKLKTMQLIENKSGSRLWEEGNKADYLARLRELDKLHRILSASGTVMIGSGESDEMISREYNETLFFTIYQLTDNKGKAFYVGSTAFPKKRVQYMKYVDLHKENNPNRFFGFMQLFRTKEEKFWEWFSENEINLFNAKNMEDVYIQKLLSKIKKVHPGLTFEFSTVTDGKKILVISADGISKYFPHVIKLVNEPKLITRWIIVPFRQRLNMNGAFSIKIGDSISDWNNFYFVIKDTGRKLDLNIYVKGVDTVNNTVINAVFLLLDSAIGEYDVVTKIGRVDVNPFSDLKGSDKVQAFSMLPAVVDRL